MWTIIKFKEEIVFNYWFKNDNFDWSKKCIRKKNMLFDIVVYHHFRNQFPVLLAP